MTDSTKCLRCGADSDLDDWQEVDVGIGVIKGAFVWNCPEHGRFNAEGTYFDDARPEPPLPESFEPLDGSYVVADMNVFRAAALRAANGEAFVLPPGLVRRVR